MPENLQPWCPTRISSRTPSFYTIYQGLREAVEFNTLNHFVDYANLIFIDKSLKKVNNYVNGDLKLLAEWMSFLQILARLN